LIKSVSQTALAILDLQNILLLMQKPTPDCGSASMDHEPISLYSKQVQGNVRVEIAQLFDFTPLFQYFIILDMHLQRMESLTEIT